MNKTEWQAKEEWNCYECEYHQLGCKCGECGDEFDCPFERGWTKGQVKLLEYQRDRYHRPEFYIPLDRHAIQEFLDIIGE